MESFAWLFNPQNNISSWNEHLIMVSFIFLVISLLIPILYFLLPYKRDTEIFRARVIYTAGAGIIALFVIFYVLLVVPDTMYQASDILKIVVSYVIDAIVILLLLFLILSFLPPANFKAKKYFIKNALFFNIF